MILCDTAPIVASALSTDDDHHACVELFTGMHLAGRDLLVPATVAAEVGYLLAREAGARVEALFLAAGTRLRRWTGVTSPSSDPGTSTR